MKKFRTVCLGLAFIVLMTGCGGNNSEKTLVCTMNQDSDGLNMEQTISMTFKKDKVDRMKMDVKTKVTDEDVKSNWEEFTKAMDTENQETDKNGISLKVTKDDKNYEYTVTIDVDVNKASKEDLETYGLDDLTSDNGTLEENKKSAEADGFTCKVE